ncbi:hypothetical protein LTR37_011830 [Vermiconidia calcicola]|uniref:Uncharacterized protein n=1 Tax=Vermiconidia calcicola TaxID=1690605 RepID=A0ACC3N0W6_9PEZI|nr:hypothetical protein LTR37_011830 [Vermiconidia calcicola]
MRFSAPSGPLAALFKLLAAFLFAHLLAGHSSAYPLESSDVTAWDSLGQLDAPTVLPRILQKRSNCQPWDDHPELYNCDGAVPGVDEAVERMQAFGVVGTIPSVFYTNMPFGLSRTRTWASCFFAGEPEAAGRDDWLYTIWKRITDNKWVASESFWVYENQPDDVSEEDNAYYRDLVLKHVSQAYAEVSAGDIYLVAEDATTPDNRDWNTDQAWGGWEWPALTRNSNVKRILRVDPDSGEEPLEIWTSADGPQGIEPKGFRDSTPQTPRD